MTCMRQGWGRGKNKLGSERRKMFQQGSCWRTYLDIPEVKYRWLCQQRQVLNVCPEQPTAKGGESNRHHRSEGLVVTGAEHGSGKPSSSTVKMIVLHRSGALNVLESGNVKILEKALVLIWSDPLFFISEETETQKYETACQKSHSQWQTPNSNYLNKQ